MSLRLTNTVPARHIQDSRRLNQDILVCTNTAPAKTYLIITRRYRMSKKTLKHTQLCRTNIASTHSRLTYTDILAYTVRHMKTDTPTQNKTWLGFTSDLQTKT